MTDPSDSSDVWRPSLTPEVGAVRYKWGARHDGDPAVWQVEGPGDGQPTHEDALMKAWGRAPQPGTGDILGYAVWHPPNLTITTYYKKQTPAAILEWFAKRHPAGTVRTS